MVLYQIHCKYLRLHCLVEIPALFTSSVYIYSMRDWAGVLSIPGNERQNPFYTYLYTSTPYTCGIRTTVLPFIS